MLHDILYSPKPSPGQGAAIEPTTIDPSMLGVAIRNPQATTVQERLKTFPFSVLRSISVCHKHPMGSKNPPPYSRGVINAIEVYTLSLAKREASGLLAKSRTNRLFWQRK